MSIAKIDHLPKAMGLSATCHASEPRQFGLVAGEVEKAAPDLANRDRDGKLQTVRSDAVNAMLLNEFLKEHRKVEELQAAVEQLTAHLKEQDSRIQRI